MTDSTVLVSPAERHPAMLALGPTDSLPEEWGCDAFWLSPAGPCGIQRKHVPDDFLASALDDGRLGKELGQMRGLAFAGLILEGHFAWTSEGVLYDQHRRRYTRKQHWGFLLSIQSRGITVMYAASTYETAELIQEMVEWTKKDKHISLDVRPKAPKDWGPVARRRDLLVHVLSGFPTVSVGRAGMTLDAHGGDIPLAWAHRGQFLEPRDLLAVPGLGPHTVRAMWSTLNPNGERK